MNDFAKNMLALAAGANEPNGNGHHRYGRPEQQPLGRQADGSIAIPPHITRLPDVLSLKDAPEPPPRQYVLEGLVPEGAATAIYGAGGVAKSLLAMSLATSVARGEDRWLGRDVRGSAALYLDFELTSDEQIRRARSLCRGAGYDGVPDELFYMSAVGHDSEAAFWKAYEACEGRGVGLVVIDSFGLALQGEAESASEVIAFFRNRLEPFLAEDIAVLMIDHQAKGAEGGRYQNRTTFGSVYKRNLVRSELQVEALDQDEIGGTLDLVFRHTKHNFGPQARPFGARLGFNSDEIQVGPTDLSPQRLAQEEGMKATDRVLMALEYMETEDATVKGVADYCDMQPKTAGNALRSLERRGKVDTQPGTQRWRLVRRPPDFTRTKVEEEDEELTL